MCSVVYAFIYSHHSLTRSIAYIDAVSYARQLLLREPLVRVDVCVSLRNVHLQKGDTTSGNNRMLARMNFDVIYYIKIYRLRTTHRLLFTAISNINAGGVVDLKLTENKCSYKNT